MPRTRLFRLLLLLAVGATAILGGPGGTAASAREHHAAGAEEITFRNRADTAIDCSLPSFHDGKDFRVEARADHRVEVSELTDVHLVDQATCAGRTVSVVEASLTGGNLTFEYAGSKLTALGYFYVHAHLVSGALPDCTSTSPPKRQQYWAETTAGFCRGHFTGGEAPYDRTAGVTTWSPAAGGAIQVRMATRREDGSGVGLDCVARSRGSDACYTDFATQGTAPAGQPGGPLRLEVQNDRDGLRYVLLRGFCANSDKRCLPH